MNIAEPQKKKYLRACPLFEGLQNDVITRLASRAHGVFLPRGKILFHQGDPSNGLYVVCSGLVRVSITDEEGHVLTLALPEIGTPLGELALVKPYPRSATVSALEDSLLLHLETTTMVELLDEKSALASHLIDFLSQRLRQSNDILHDLAFASLQQRLLHKLAELGCQHGELRKDVLDLRRKFSQNALAEMLGVTREAVNKQLKLLQEHGLIVMQDGIIQLQRPAEILRNFPES